MCGWFLKGKLCHPLSSNHPLPPKMRIITIQSLKLDGMAEINRLCAGSCECSFVFVCRSKIKRMWGSLLMNVCDERWRRFKHPLRHLFLVFVFPFALSQRISFSLLFFFLFFYFYFPPIISERFFWAWVHLEYMYGGNLA